MLGEVYAFLRGLVLDRVSSLGPLWYVTLQEFHHGSSPRPVQMDPFMTRPEHISHGAYSLQPDTFFSLIYLWHLLLEDI